jgi:hypothetical protein
MHHLFASIKIKIKFTEIEALGKRSFSKELVFRRELKAKISSKIV